MLLSAAVQNATGVNMTELPLTADRGLEAISVHKRDAARKQPTPTIKEKEVA